MDGNRKYGMACLILAVCLLAAAVIYGVLAWRAAKAQEPEMAYLRGFDWEVPLTESWTAATYADELFGSCIGKAKMIERAEAYASVFGSRKLPGTVVCREEEYQGDRQELVFTKQTGGGLNIYLDQDGEVLFRQKDLNNRVSCLTDTYVITCDAGMNWSLADLAGNVLYAGEKGRKIRGIDNRYAAVAKNEVYDLQTGKTRKLSGSYTMIKACDGGNYPYAAVRGSGENAHMIYLDGELEPVWDQNLLEDSYWHGTFSEGLIYGVKPLEKLARLNRKVQRGYFDQKGRLAVKTPNARYASCFSEGKGVVYASGNKVYAIDKAGTVLFEKKLSKDPAWEETNLSWKSAFCGGRAVIFDGEQCGVVDAAGNWLAEPVFDQIYLAADGRAVVIRGKKFGVLRFGREAAQ